MTLISGEGEHHVEIAREVVPAVPIQADAVAAADTVINPVDLGAILVPADRLLLGDGQSGHVDVAAISPRA